MKTLPLAIPKLDAKKLGFFRYGYFDNDVLLSNDAGAWMFLGREAFTKLLSGDLPEDYSIREELKQKGFVRDSLDLEELAIQVRRKKSFLGQGPHLHIVITTLRCNQSCKYCHASRTSMDRVDTDMSLATAKEAVDMAMQSTSKYICFEYTGGEPTINMDVIRFMVEYSKEKNRHNQKIVEHSVVTNMTYMTEENAKYLV